MTVFLILSCVPSCNTPCVRLYKISLCSHTTLLHSINYPVHIICSHNKLLASVHILCHLHAPSSDAFLHHQQHTHYFEFSLSMLVSYKVVWHTSILWRCGGLHPPSHPPNILILQSVLIQSLPIYVQIIEIHMYLLLPYFFKFLRPIFVAITTGFCPHPIFLYFTKSWFHISNATINILLFSLQNVFCLHPAYKVLSRYHTPKALA